LASQYLKFVLLDRNTGYWHKESNKDFVVACAAPALAQQGVAAIAQAKRHRAAHLLWEEAGCPHGSPDFGPAADALIDQAAAAGMSAADIEWRVEDLTHGATLAERLRVAESTGYQAAPADTQHGGESFWGDAVLEPPAHVHAAAAGWGTGSPPPSPRSRRRRFPGPNNGAPSTPARLAVSAAVAPSTFVPSTAVVLPVAGDVHIAVAKRNRAAHLLWEEAGCPTDGQDFGPAAQALINLGAACGLSVADIEWRVEDLSAGATLAQRLAGVQLPARTTAPVSPTTPRAPVVHAAAAGWGAPLAVTGSPPPSPRSRRRSFPGPHGTTVAATPAAAAAALVAAPSFLAPAAAAWASPEPSVAGDVHIDVAKRNRAAHMMWEEAGCPTDGQDFGPAAQSLINQAAAAGLPVAEIEWRVEDLSKGATLAARLGLLAAATRTVQAAAPASAAANNASNVDARQPGRAPVSRGGAAPVERPASPVSPRQRRRAFPQPHSASPAAAATPAPVSSLGDA
jgi:hypothetical protein